MRNEYENLRRQKERGGGVMSKKRLTERILRNGQYVTDRHESLKEYARTMGIGYTSFCRELAKRRREGGG